MSCLSGSVTNDLGSAIQTFKHTRVYKTDKYGYVNTAIGMVSKRDSRMLVFIGRFQ